RGECFDGGVHKLGTLKYAVGGDFRFQLSNALHNIAGGVVEFFDAQIVENRKNIGQWAGHWESPRFVFPSCAKLRYAVGLFMLTVDNFVGRDYWPGLFDVHGCI